LYHTFGHTHLQMSSQLQPTIIQETQQNVDLLVMLRLGSSATCWPTMSERLIVLLFVELFSKTSAATKAKQEEITNNSIFVLKINSKFRLIDRFSIVKD